MPITPAQSRAARGLLDMSQGQLAAASGLSLRTVQHFEGSERQLSPATLEAIERALEAAGVEFLSEDARKGPGVRLVKRKGAPRRARD